MTNQLLCDYRIMISRDSYNLSEMTFPPVRLAPSMLKQQSSSVSGRGFCRVISAASFRFSFGSPRICRAQPPLCLSWWKSQSTIQFCVVLPVARTFTYCCQCCVLLCLLWLWFQDSPAQCFSLPALALCWCSPTAELPGGLSCPQWAGHRTLSSSALVELASLEEHIQYIKYPRWKVYKDDM